MNNIQNDHQLDDVIRQTNSAGADVKVHGSGFRVYWIRARVLLVQNLAYSGGYLAGIDIHIIL